MGAGNHRPWRLSGFPFLGLILAALSACGSIPPESVKASASVTTGISRMSDNTVLILEGWRKTLYAQLDDRFEAMYAQVETQYRAKNSIPAQTALTEDQARSVAATYVVARDKVRAEIDKQIDALLSQTKAQADEVASVNRQVNALLSSAVRVDQTRSGLLSTVSNLTGITLPDFNAIVAKSLN